MKPQNVFVVGGANLDLLGTAYQALKAGDSNPGIVSETPGGVGRNIAETLVHLGCSVQLITALGEDPAGKKIRENCWKLGIGLDYALTLPKGRTGSYLCINHPNGDLAVAVSDTQILDGLTAEQFLEPCRGQLDRADLIVMDANLPEALLYDLAAHSQAPLAADPVSAAKAERLKRCLPYLMAIKPNRAEAQVLTGVPLEGKLELSALEKAAEILLKSGTHNVFITLGGDGVYYDNGEQRGIQRCCPGCILNTSGCGDTFLSASALALVEGESIYRAALLGVSAAAICAEAQESVSPKLTMENIERKADHLFDKL